MKAIFSFLWILVSLLACSGAQDANESTNQSASSLANQPLADYELLFMGNSHSSLNDLPGLVTLLLETGDPAKSANAANAPGWKFLADRIDDSETLEFLQSRAWTHVILQAQKYSTSGQYFYPTTAAEEWIRRVKAREAIPILFPEWPRRGNFEEGLRVHQLHLSIAAKEAACVAPIGLVWDEMITTYPNVSLHAADGNHSNLKGALLTAFVFYQVIAKDSANSLPYIPSVNVSESLQTQMKQVVSSVTSANLNCL